jgi:hypothetical protein
LQTGAEASHACTVVLRKVISAARLKSKFFFIVYSLMYRPDFFGFAALSFNHTVALA